MYWLTKADIIAGLDIPSPWTFHMRNPRNPAEHHLYAGVLEFIAPEGVVYLPAWVCQLPPAVALRVK